MTNLMQRGEDWLGARQQAAAGIDVVHYPAGSVDRQEPIANAVLIPEPLDVGNWREREEGDGAIRWRARLVIPVTVTITEERGPADPSKFLIDSEIWVTKRVLTRDHAMQTVAIERLDRKHTKRANR